MIRRVADARGLEPVLDLRGRDAVLLVRADGGAAALRSVLGTFPGAAGAALGGARLAGGVGRTCVARIERLLGVDLEDVEARFQLELAVRLLEARGRVAGDGAAAPRAALGGPC